MYTENDKNKPTSKLGYQKYIFVYECAQVKEVKIAMFRPKSPESIRKCDDTRSPECLHNISIIVL